MLVSTMQAAMQEEMGNTLGLPGARLELAKLDVMRSHGLATDQVDELIRYVEGINQGPCDTGTKARGRHQLSD
jgi:hypothetical protein